MSQASKMIKHSSIYAVGNVSRRLVGFIMLPIYTRYLTPADYGIVELLVLMVSLVELFFGARLFQAVTRYYYEQDDKRKSDQVMSTAFIITAIISSLGVIVIIAFQDPISHIIFGTQSYSLLVALFGVQVLTQALEYYALGYIRIQQRPWLFISVSTIKLVMQLALNIILIVVMELGVMGVVLSNVIASSVFTLAMTAYTFWHTGIRFNGQLARKLLMFSWPLWFSGIAALYIGSSNRYYLRLFSSLDDVGLFALGAKFAAIIGFLIWMPFQQYWDIERFNLFRQPNPVPIYQSVFRMVSTLLVLTALGISLFSGPVIKLIATPEFHSAGASVPYFAFAAVFQCLVLFTEFSFYVTEKTGWISWINYTTALIITVFYLLLIPSFGFIGAAQALLLAAATHFLLVHFAAKRHYDMRLPMRPLMLYLCIGFTASFLAEYLQSSDLVIDLAIKSAIYLISVVLIGGSLLIHRPVREQLLRFKLKSGAANA